MFNQGLPNSTNVPYLGYDRKVCPKNATILNEAAISGFNTITSNDEEEIACKLATNGPMTIAMHVANSFLRYSNGIYDDNVSCGPNVVPNHAVLLG